MADKAKFVGSIRHTEATLQKLFKTEYRTYHQLRILIQLAVGFVLAAAALTVRMDRILQAVLLLAGCLLMIGRDAPAAFQADKAMDARRGKLPHNVCTFLRMLSPCPARAVCAWNTAGFTGWWRTTNTCTCF